MASIGGYSLLRRSRRLNQQTRRTLGGRDTPQSIPKPQPNADTVQPCLVHRSSPITKQSRKPPKPLNSFMCFRREYNQRTLSLDVNQCNISSRAAREWCGMTMEERQPYILQAIQERANHAQKYPRHGFKPETGAEALPVKTERRKLQTLLSHHALEAYGADPEPIGALVKPEEGWETRVVKEEVQSSPPLLTSSPDSADEGELEFVLTENIPELKLSEGLDAKRSIAQTPRTALLHRTAFNPRTIIGFLTDFDGVSRGSHSPSADLFEFKWNNERSSPVLGALEGKEDMFAEWIHEGMCGEEYDWSRNQL